MHILLIHQAFASLDEAGGTRHLEMAVHLASHGHVVTIIASPVSYLSGKSRWQRSHWVEREELSTRITLLRTYTYPALHRSFIHRVFSFISFMISSFLVGLSVRNVDLLWGTSPPIFQGITAWLLARIKNVPFLFEVRDLWPAFAIAVGVLRNPMLIRASLWLERFLYRHADQVIVNSPGFTEHVKQHGARQVELIPNGVDPQQFDPALDGSVFRKENHLEQKFVVVYAGAHGLSNDLEIVLQAAAILQSQHHIHFVLVGDGKDKPKLISQAQDMRLTNVLFHPPVAKANMAQILAAANACLAILKPIALYRTTYPNKVFDYMAAAKPVVLVIDGVIRQVIEEAGAGVFVQPGDAQMLAQTVQYLAEHPHEAQQMGICGRKYVQTHFNRVDISDRFVKLIERIRGYHE